MRVLGVCAGQGVMLYPFRKYLVGNIEPRGVFYSPHNIQWKENFNNVQMVRSFDKLDIDKSSVDIIIGHPDCGHSSVLAYSRAKKLSDPLKNHSLLIFIQALNHYKPKLFLMENLEKFLDSVGKDNFENQIPDFEVVYIKGSVSIFGNSQKTRKRLVMVGIHKKFFGNKIKKMVKHFSKVYQVRDLEICINLLAGLGKEDPELCHIREDIDNVITMYAGQKYTLRKIQGMWLDNPGTSRWPVRGRKFTTAPAVYRNLDNDYPATARKANRQFNSLGVQMSPRELARIQGVPDNFNLHFEPSKKLYWINKGRLAVTKTPPMEISLWFKSRLRKLPKPIP